MSHNNFLIEHWHRFQVVFGTKFGCYFASQENQVIIDVGWGIWLTQFLLACDQFELGVPVNEFHYQWSLICSTWDPMTHTDIAFAYFQPHLLRHFDHFLIRIFICVFFQTEDADVVSPPILLVGVSLEQREQFGALVDWLGRYSPEPRHLGCRTEPAQEGSLHEIFWYALGEPHWNPGRTLVSLRLLPRAPDEIGQALLLVISNGSSFGLWGRLQIVVEVY